MSKSKPPKVFSGDESKKLWDTIWKVRDAHTIKQLRKATFDALYLMGCHCQNLEHKVDRPKRSK
jgi:hypothetical protein